MRILHVLQSLDPAWGGIARVVPMLAERLNRAGDQCRIATLCGDRFGKPPPFDGLDVLAFEAKAKSRLGKSKEFKRRVRELVNDADVIHLHGLWTAQNRLTAKAARKLGRPYIMTPHSMMMPWAWNRSAWKKRPVGWLFEHKNLREAACLHALAEGEAAHMRTLGFNQNIEVIPNGLDPAEFEHLPSAEGIEARFPATRGKKWVLFVGRIAVQKGIVPAMQASFDVFAASRDWHGVVVGPDEFGLRKAIEAAVARKGMKDRVTFTGMLGRQDILACLGRASILLQPSLSEGLSMSILEALAAGVPVVISDACNMPEVNDCNAGRVVEPRRRPISTALRELVAMSDEQRRSMGRNGRALVKSRFTWTTLIPQYQRMYKRVVGR